MVAIVSLVVGCGDANRSAGTTASSGAASGSTSPPAASAAASASASPSTGNPSASSVGPTAPSGSQGSSGSPTASAAASTGPVDLADLSVDLEQVVGGFSDPLLVANAGDGTGRLFVVEQGGKVWVVENGQRRDRPFLDLSDDISVGGERGLLGLAFAPGFGGAERRLYVDYTDRDGNTVVAELQVGSDPNVADASTLRTILHIDQPYANHNGGALAFDDERMLLVALGDGGSGGDPQGRAQNLKELLGKILRLDVLSPGDAAYAIPRDNPFVGRTDARPEILHYGMRNPWRLSVDPPTGDLWIGDVGQNAWEEVDVAPRGQRGLNFGWNAWEGRHCYQPPSGCSPKGITMPVVEYSHSAGCTVIGGSIYRGTGSPALRGAYLFADYCSGTLWGIDAGSRASQEAHTLLETGRTISSFGTGEDGEMYLTDLGSGDVLRIVARR